MLHPELNGHGLGLVECVSWEEERVGFPIEEVDRRVLIAFVLGRGFG